MLNLILGRRMGSLNELVTNPSADWARSHVRSLESFGVTGRSAYRTEKLQTNKLQSKKMENVHRSKTRILLSQTCKIDLCILMRNNECNMRNEDFTVLPKTNDGPGERHQNDLE